MGQTISGDQLTVEYPNGDIFLGSLVTGKRQGRGTYTTSSGHQYDGDWVNDQRQGHGTMTFSPNNNNDSLLNQEQVFNAEMLRNSLQQVQQFSARISSKLSHILSEQESPSPDTEETAQEQEQSHASSPVSDTTSQEVQETQETQDGLDSLDKASAESNASIKLKQSSASVFPPISPPLSASVILGDFFLTLPSAEPVQEEQLSPDESSGEPSSPVQTDPIESYIGEWKNNLKHGRGTYYYPNGDVYIGSWENGMKHGPSGRYTFKLSGCDITYEGEFSNDCIQGRGRISFTNGDVFMGKWINNEIHGSGLLTYSDGTQVKEEFEHSERIRSTVLATVDDKGELVPVEQVVWEDEAVLYIEDTDTMSPISPSQDQEDSQSLKVEIPDVPQDVLVAPFATVIEDPYEDLCDIEL